MCVNPHHSSKLPIVLVAGVVRGRSIALRRTVLTLFSTVLVSASLAVQAQEKPVDPNPNPNPNIREEPVNQVTASASVSPTSIAAYTGTATLSWSSTNAHSCEYSGEDRSVSGTETVGPYTSSGTKSFTVTCTGTGEGNFIAATVDLTVNRAPRPVITTDLSRTLLLANVDTFTVDFSTQYADYCTYEGTRYPTAGTVTLGPYPEGDHSLSFTCSGDGGDTPHTIRWKSRNRVSFTASVSSGSILADNEDTVTVSWNAPAADDCSISNTAYEKEDSQEFGPYSHSQAGTKSATVTCRNGLGSASSTATWEVEAPELPGAPRNLRSSENPSDDGSFVLRWDPPSSGATPTGYVANLQGSSSNPLSKGFSSRSLSISGLSNGRYTYEVQACIGTASAPVCGGSDTITVVVDIPPNVPRNLSASPNPSTTGSFRLNWNAPAGTSAATGYLVYLQGSTSGPLSKTFSARTLSITGLSNGRYTYEVQACTGTANTPNCGAAASVTVTVDRPDPVPGVPRNLAASQNPSKTGSTVLSWGAPSGTPAATGYLVTLQGSMSGPLSKTFSARTLSITGLSNGSYTYEVQACTGDASEPNCGTAAAITVIVAIPPLAPANLAANPNPSTTGSTVLTWDAPASGAVATGYLVNLQGSDSNPLSKPFADRTLTVSGLSSGSHTYQVQACSGTQSKPNCGAAATVAVTVNIPIAAPDDLVATPDRSTDGSVVLTWDAPESATTLTGYLVNLQGSDDNPLAKTFSARTLTIIGLTDGTYVYEVQACTGDEDAPVCGTAATVTVTVERSGPAPGVPGNLAADPNPSTTGDTVLTWDAPSGTSAATGYLVTLQGSTSGPLDKAFSARTLTISDLSNGSYIYEVQACDGTASEPNCGDAATVTVTVNIPGAVTASVVLDPESIPVDTGTSVLTWSGTNATSCTLNGAALSGTSGTRTLGPFTTAGEQAYTVGCTGTGDATATASATLEVAGPTDPIDPPTPEPTVSMTLSKSNVTADVDTVVVTWTSTDATACSRVDAPLQTSGSLTVGPFGVGTHPVEIVCTGTGGSASVTKNIISVAAPLTVTASLSSTAVKAHAATVDLTWSSTGATWCERDGAALSGVSGSETGFGPFYEGSHDFTVTCGRDSDTETASVTVTVRAATAVACSAHPAAPDHGYYLDAGVYTYSVTGGNSGTIFGSNPYTSESPIAKAAVHAGIVAVGERAIVRLTREDGQFTFPGSTRNGVTSVSLDTWRYMYRLDKVSDCEAVAPTLPAAPANLVASENPSPDGSFDLNWDAPTGTTPTGYLVYRSGSKSGYLSKTFADRTLSITGLSNGSYAYKVFACTGTAASPDCGPAASITVTVEIPDNDNDGIPDTTDPDDDNDGMTDVWELENDLDENDASDATQDADLDGHNNLAEFTAGSDPNWNLSKPGSIPVLAAGFDSRYTVQKGLINNDQLQDLLIQDPTSGILPAVTKFVLIQQATGGFSLESTDGHTLPSSTALTSINSAIRLHDLNADGVSDMLLNGLDGFIEGANDQIIYGNRQEHMYEIPREFVELTDFVVEFFREMNIWLEEEDQENYFYNQAPLLAWAPEVDMNESGFLPDPITGQIRTGTSPLQLTVQEKYSYGCFFFQCIHVKADSTDLLYNTYGLGLGYDRRPPYTPYVVDVFDDENDPNLWAIFRIHFLPGTTYKVPDYSPVQRYAETFIDYLFNRMTGEYDRELHRGSLSARRISQGLEEVLDTKVFASGLEYTNVGVFPQIGEIYSDIQVVQDILELIKDVLGRIVGIQGTGNGMDGDDDVDPPLVVRPIIETEEIDPMVEISTIATQPLKITANPEMPAVTFNARVTGADGDGIDVSYQWYASVSYRGVGEQSITNDQGEVEPIDKVHLFESRVPEAGTLSGTNGASSQENSWTVPWGEVLLGGNLTIYVTATISSGGEEIASVSDSETYMVFGTNPSLANIQEITGNSVEKLAVSWQESCHSQFDYPGDRCRARNDMLPMYGEPDGWGIMQIDRIPGVTKSAGIFWNWRTNLQTGTDYLDLLYRQSLNYLNTHHEPPTEGVPNSGWSWDPDDVETDPSVSIRVWNDTFSRYNTGDPIHSPNGFGGNENCSADRNPEDSDALQFLGCVYRDSIRTHMSSQPWAASSNSN